MMPLQLEWHYNTMASIPLGIKDSKNITIKGKTYLFENYRNKEGKSRWRTKLICDKCKKERYIDKRIIVEGKYNSGLCLHCNWVKIGVASNTKFNKGKNHPHYKGGRNINNQGYVNILMEIKDPLYLMKNKSGYVMEHRYIMAQKLGRILKLSEHVHHLNGNKQDNRIENLVLIDGSIHKIVTALEEKIKRLEIEIIKLKGGTSYR